MTEPRSSRFATWAAVALLVAFSLLLLLGAILSLAPLEFPQFVAAFILGDPRWYLLAAAAVGTTGAVLVWRFRRTEGRVRAYARVTGVAGALLTALAAGRHFGSYSTSTVRFPGSNIVISARLYTPRGSGVHRGIVLVPGSEAVDAGRYHSFADRLGRAGFVVLVPDKRGVGGSGGVFQPPSPDDDRGRALLDTLAGDAVAALQYLRTLGRVDSLATGYFGLSQAGWVLPLAEQRPTGAAFAVIVSGPAVSTHEEDLFSRLSGESADHFGWKPPAHPFDSINAAVAVAPPGGFDPRPLLARLELPTLWLYGEWDNSIPVEKSAQTIAQLRDAGRPFSVRTYAYGNHGLFVMRGPAKRLLPYYPDGFWTSAIAWIDSVAAPRSGTPAGS